MKRSTQVALLLMGAAAVGAAASRLMPGEDCSPDHGEITASNTSAECRRTSSSSGGGSHSSSWHGLFDSDSSSTRAGSDGGSGEAGSSHASRGGFGSTAAHFSGGG